MKKISDVFKSIRFAKLDPEHDKPHSGGSTDDEMHYTVGEKEFEQQVKHVKKRAMQEEVSTPPIGVRSLYTKMYAKHGGTASKAKDAQSKAYAEVEKKHGKDMRNSLEAFHKKNMNEAVKDKFDIGEYDQEGDMAKSDLRSILANAKRVHDMLKDSDNLPEWVQSKITKAEDYMSTVANYMEAEMNEEVEQIDELSKSTLASYAKKATHDARMNMAIGKDFERVGANTRKPEYKAGAKKWEDKYKSDARRREAGTMKAIDRLAKEEVEELDELSNELLHRYKEKSADDARAADAKGDFKKGDKRFSGIVKATNKQFANRKIPKISEDWSKTGKEAKHVETGEKTYEYREVDNEGKPTGKREYRNAQGKPMSEEVKQIDEISAETKASYVTKAKKDIQNLKPHTKGEYGDIAKNIIKRREKGIAMAKEEVDLEEENKPTNPELWSRAVAMAKSKFDVYPSAYANGWAAKWYKSKGGGWRSVNEAKDDLPFTPDKPKKQSVVPGKYGAGYSTARDLARKAMQKQIEKMKKPIKEEMSKKAKIVKDIMKNKNSDKFESDPIISKTVDDKES